jgi:hypothetical protein
MIRLVLPVLDVSAALAAPVDPWLRGIWFVHRRRVINVIA